MGYLLVAVAAIAAAPQPSRRGTVPTPQEIIGFAPGTQRKLADFAQVSSYFRALAAASPRVRLYTIGKSTEGREMILAAISSEANLQRLARYKDIARQLADGRGLTDEQAHQLAREGKAIVWIDFGLHATEVAPAQIASQVAYAIATSESEEIKRIRDNVIFVTVPVMNPDGLDIVSHWYRDQLDTPYEGTTPPFLYQKYAGHDNNRDWYMQNLAETRVITNQLYHEWYPQLLYNQHQSGQTSPRIWTPPMDDPVNPNMHPLINRGITLLGVGIQERLEQEGKTGAEGFSQYLQLVERGHAIDALLSQHRVDTHRDREQPAGDAGDDRSDAAATAPRERRERAASRRPGTRARGAAARGRSRIRPTTSSAQRWRCCASARTIARTGCTTAIKWRGTRLRRERKAIRTRT